MSYSKFISNVIKTLIALFLFLCIFGAFSVSWIHL